jgi:hypothetical protein
MAFRNFTTTQQKIQSISMLQINTKEEAVAFLRAISNIELQIANVLQRENFRELAIKNQAAPTPVKVEEPTPEPEPEVEPLVVEEEEHTEDQKTERVSKLKKALKK